MPRPYSADLRRAALRACARDDDTRRRIARRYGIGESTLCGWLRQEREEDRRRPKPHSGGRVRVINAAGEVILRELVAADNDATLAAYAAAFEARTGRKVSAPMVCKALKRLGLGRKKPQAPLPAALLARSQPDRALLVEDQDPAPCQGGPFRRGARP